MYTIKSTQHLPISIDEAWDFLSNPRNLQIITPPFLGFEIISGADKKMYAGQIIQYTVRPLLGIKLEWITEITYLKENTYFVDEQRYGPYEMWHHKHFLRTVPGGVELEDIIDYKLPMGFLGNLFHKILVKPKLDTIFEFRRKKLTELFGEYNHELNKTG